MFMFFFIKLHTPCPPLLLPYLFCDLLAIYFYLTEIPSANEALSDERQAVRTACDQQPLESLL